jgi:hypothetical protein
MMAGQDELVTIRSLIKMVKYDLFAHCFFNCSDVYFYFIHISICFPSNQKYENGDPAFCDLHRKGR